MTRGWTSSAVADCLAPVPTGGKSKIQTRDYKPSGRFPIVDQGQERIAGWTDDDQAVISSPLPLIVFGDHTRAFKFVEMPFARGADGTQLLRPKDDIDPRFFFYACRALDLPARGYNRHFTALKEMELAYPRDVGEQRDIARVLTAAECALIQQVKSLDVLKNLKRASMRELCTRGLRGEAQKETEIGPLPESWDVVRLGDLFRLKHGYAFDGAGFRSSGAFVLLTPGHFAEEGGFRDQGSKTRYYTGDIPDGYMLSKDDLLVVMTEQKPGLLGSSVLVPKSGVFLHNQRLGLVVELDEHRLDWRFLYHLFNLDAVRSEISRTATGSKVRHTSPDRIRAVTIGLPPPPEQREIAAILDAIDRKIDLHRQKRSVLEELFQSLLRKLMTGEVCVDQLDLAALEGSEKSGAAA